MSFVSIDFKIKTIDLDGKRIKLQIWDTAGRAEHTAQHSAQRRAEAGRASVRMTLLPVVFADSALACVVCRIASPRSPLRRAVLLGQERFRTITTAYYRGAMGILLVYDVTDEQSFQNIRNWIRNIEQHAADNVDKILVGNKCDMTSEKLVETARGQALADEYGIKFFETSAKSNINVVEAFTSIAADIKKRLMDNPSAAAGTAGAPGAAGGVKLKGGAAAEPAKSGCC